MLKGEQVKRVQGITWKSWLQPELQKVGTTEGAINLVWGWRGPKLYPAVKGKAMNLNGSFTALPGLDRRQRSRVLERKRYKEMESLLFLEIWEEMLVWISLNFLQGVFREFKVRYRLVKVQHDEEGKAVPDVLTVPLKPRLIHFSLLWVDHIPPLLEHRFVSL